MNIEQLKQARDLVVREFNNLTSAIWLNSRQTYLQGRYDLYNELIDKMNVKEQSSATDNAIKTSNSNNHKREQSVSRSTA